MSNLFGLSISRRVALNPGGNFNASGVILHQKTQCRYLFNVRYMFPQLAPKEIT